jgi:catechol 2,3-dioxygenase-like lactoylglutathione lyase family enzyme
MITGIEQLTFGVVDQDKAHQFLLDWGLKHLGDEGLRRNYETLNGCRIITAPADDPALPPAFEPGSTLRELTWAVRDAPALDALRRNLAGTPGYADAPDGPRCVDSNGLALRFSLSSKRRLDIKGMPMNTWDHAARVDAPSTFYERATPIEVGHVVVFTADLKALESFYTEKLGFVVSDRYPGRGLFLRGEAQGGHHDFFALQLPEGKRGLNHVAFTVRDIHEVFGGGIAFSKLGHETQLGPGRHPISSAYFWYFKSPLGGLFEYYADEDMLTEKWQPREFPSKPELFAEWAIAGGIDGVTRRQKNAA